MLDGLPIANLGWGTIVVAAVWMLFTDRLVTKGRLTEAREDRDRWRNVVEELVPLVKEQLTYARAADQVLQSLPDAAARARKRSP